MISDGFLKPSVDYQLLLFTEVINLKTLVFDCLFVATNTNITVNHNFFSPKIVNSWNKYVLLPSIIKIFDYGQYIRSTKTYMTLSKNVNVGMLNSPKTLSARLMKRRRISYVM